MSPTPEQVFAQVADRPGAAWLDGGQGDEGWSILTWDPVDVVTDGRDWPAAGRARRLPVGTAGVPFSGGVLGYVGYEAGSRVEGVPAGRPTPEPEVWLGRFEGALCWRHADRSWHPAGTPGFRADAARLLASAGPLPAPPPPTGVASTIPRERFLAAVERILEWIRAGDCYQVNLTRVVHVHSAGDPFAAYRRLRRADAAYGAFLRVSDRVAVSSNSPELFLAVRGREVVSVPIKGTRRRGADGEDDAQLRAELEQSPKDRAELTMIVDLVRNDLGRVAATGTVRADRREITAHPTVLHASWPVRATLRDGLDAWDALAAAFPPGSVTGAPKIRACERIRELEPEPRGVYCGAIGYAADGGDATFSVAIRTAISDGPDARYHVGGGIVADSDPAAEWDETVTKEIALGRALVSPAAPPPRRDPPGTRPPPR